MRIHSAFAVAGAVLSLCTFALMSSGCNLADENCDKGFRPSDCVTTSPDNGVVRVEVTLDAANTSVPVVLYKGTIEQNQVVVVDTMRSAVKEYSLLNGEYAVRAQYRTLINGSLATVYSIDGGRLTFGSTEYCDGTCYSTGTLILDAKYP